MKKVLNVIITLTLVLILLPITNVNAEEEKVTVRLINFEVPTDYLVSETNVNYRIEDNKFIGEIIDKDTNIVLETFSEKPDIPIQQAFSLRNNLTTRSSNTYNTTLDGTKNLVSGSTFFAAYVWARVTITAGSYWRQVDALLGCGHSAGSSGAYTLTGNQTFDGTSSYPATTVQIDINGVIEMHSQNAASAGFDIDFLKTLGFSTEVTTTNNWYARKTYNTSYAFVIMQ